MANDDEVLFNPFAVSTTEWRKLYGGDDWDHEILKSGTALQALTDYGESRYQQPAPGAMNWLRRIPWRIRCWLASKAQDAAEWFLDLAVRLHP